MKIRILAGLTIVASALFLFLQKENPVLASDHADGKRSPVVVELFTSEGCSSCPPADALLRKLEASQPVANAEIIVLGEHVDYWNYIGWTDRFSSKQFTDRQQQYANRFNLDSAYTPQMVIDGRVELNGADEAQAKKSIARAAKDATVNVAASGGYAEPDSAKLNVQVSASPDIKDAEVFVALTESGLQTQVKKGENDGRTLNHTGVVRSLVKIGEMRRGGGFTGAPVLRLDRTWKREELRAIVFVQEKESRRIVGAALVRFGT